MTTRAIEHARELTLKRFRVTVLTGPDKGTERASEAPEFAIGADAGNDLVLLDPTVSRHHCVIAATPLGFLLRDLGSTNGTTVDSLRVVSVYLRSGAVIGLGRSTLRFDSLDDDLREPLSQEEWFGRMLGASPAMRRIFALLPRIAASDSTVLIEGETGTGKGLIADALHQGSPRAKGPLIVVDCSSIPPTLIESELFGHERGAFTGAHAARAGAFEAARGGTVFLDEIGELPLDMQPKLLRALEERTIKRIGSVEPVKLDVRVIAATNRDLRMEVNKGAFRSDLFYRLNIVKLRIPPLRERREDIPLLVAHFYEQFAGEGEQPPAELMASLTRQDWPGNVRELRGAVERAVLMGDPELWKELSGRADDADGGGAMDRGAQAARLDPIASPAAVFDRSLSFRAAKERAVAQWERAYLTELVRAAGGNLSRAARLARMDRNHLRELVRRHGVAIRDE